MYTFSFQLYLFQPCQFTFNLETSPVHSLSTDLIELDCPPPIFIFNLTSPPLLRSTSLPKAVTLISRHHFDHRVAIGCMYFWGSTVTAVFDHPYKQSFFLRLSWTSSLSSLHSTKQTMASSLRTGFSRLVSTTSKNALNQQQPATWGGPTSITATRNFSSSVKNNNTEAPPKNSAGKVTYDYKDALRIEQSLLTDEEIAIK